MRNTSTTRKVLAALPTDTTTTFYGYAIKKETGLPSGTLTPILGKLQNAGWITYQWEPRVEGMQRPPRRYYRMTEFGVAEAAAKIEAYSEKVKASA
jgi:PadR family transcriptional regulator PadR